MSKLADLYHKIVIEHGRHPRNEGQLVEPSILEYGCNPICGDTINLTLQINNNIIQEIKFAGKGCTIATASASLMTELIYGKSINHAQKMIRQFNDFLSGKIDNNHLLGNVIVLAGVTKYPARIKCAALPWNTLKTSLIKYTRR